MEFVRTREQRERLNKLQPYISLFSKREQQLDELYSFPFKNIEDLKRIGYTTWTVPEDEGGLGISLYDLLLFQEYIARGDGATALCMGWHLGIMHELSENRSWDKKMFSWLCEKVKDGALVNRAATERNTGSPTRGGKPETTAIQKGDTWIISGRKTFTTMAPVLDYFLVSASIEGKEEVGEFLVPRSTEGVLIEETWDSVAMRGTASHDLILEQVAVPHKYFVEMISPRRVPKRRGWLLHIPVCYLGIAQAAHRYALQFAVTYQPNSLQAPIATLPNVQRLIGEMELEMMQARSFLYSVAKQYEEESKQSLQAEMAAVKYTVTNTAISIVDKAMRIVGARSLSEKNPLHRYYLHVRAGLHNPPMDDATISLLAQHALQDFDTEK
ncbi:acyl-CoA dehydrogenase family protein [Bacillus sp. CGMCC 1.60114]|uniref:acyl-CoA dehydrogenase family protein n=1 Tax=unclassified Bacillus (in: firmicutes) TaxID=185979 RepID=UPI00362C48DB